ncbi:Protein required for ethanol metabolism [Blastocladiella emersonii ATCC 22665]|nr:Protein required for ethanol metabolism [Blastocladiella emersonii ATCC 22665]
MVVALYTRALAKYPITTQSGATAVLFAAGDLIAQQGVEGRGWAKHQWDRTARMSAFGFFLAGPALANWYRFLDRRVTIAHPVGNLAARVALDQFAFSPVSVATFFSVNSLMEGLSVDETRAKLRQNYWTALVNNWKVWIGVQLANFYFVPVNHRLLVVNTVALGWNAYMSTLNAGKVEEVEAENGMVLAVPADN